MEFATDIKPGFLVGVLTTMTFQRKKEEYLYLYIYIQMDCYGKRKRNFLLIVDNPTMIK